MWFLPEESVEKMCGSWKYIRTNRARLLTIVRTDYAMSASTWPPFMCAQSITLRAKHDIWKSCLRAPSMLYCLTVHFEHQVD